MLLSNRARLSVDRLDDRIVPAVLINEVLVNPPDSPDHPTEYIEVLVTAGSSVSELTNLYIMALEGEKPGTGSADPGSIDLAYKVTATNVSDFEDKFDVNNDGVVDAGGGRILLTGTGHGYTDAAANAVVVTLPSLSAGVNYKGLENGASSFVVLRYTGETDPFVGENAITDLDANGSLGSGADGDGELDAIAGVAYLDGVGYLDKEVSTDFVYGAKIAYDDDYTPDVLVRDSGYTGAAFSGVAGQAGANSNAVAGQWYAADLEETRLLDGNWTIDTDADKSFGTFPSGTDLTSAGENNPA